MTMRSQNKSSETTNLAIVIPAYKQQFLEEALNSIANQTCTLFNVYIGDDASPNNLIEIVSKYHGKINIVYHRFPDNLGSRDLVGHWERCIDMIKDEEWIWLFSDDDLMSSNCVEVFYQYKEYSINFDLFRFNLHIIDETGKVTAKTSPFPNVISGKDFFTKRIKHQIQSRAIEYIFSRAKYLSEGKLNHYDLAWCADDAAWIKFSGSEGIKTLTEGCVYWRSSGINISSINTDKDLVLRKLRANIAHLKWSETYFSHQKAKESTTSYEKFRWAVSVLILAPVFPTSEKWMLLKSSADELNYKNMKPLALLYLLYIELKLRFF